MKHGGTIRMLSASFLFCFFLTSVTSVSSHTSYSTKGETDLESLLAIKNLVTEDPYGVISSWNSSRSFCKWQGVTCSRRHHQRVTMLVLPMLKLVGSISPSIGNLTYLRVLNLSNNFFYGPIPHEIGRLYLLQHLQLSNNSLAGEIPSNVTSCSSLRTISLSGNNLEGRILGQFSFLPKLSVLDLQENNLIGTIHSSLGNLSLLRVLSLESNFLNGSVPYELGRLSNLEFLQLSFNNFSGTLPSQLYNISSIFYFSITDNHLEGQLPSDLGITLPKLEVFHIAANQFSGQITDSLSNASCLSDINLSYNSLSGPLPFSLGSLRYLRSIRFGHNRFGSKGWNDLNSLITSLSNCTNLMDLIVYHNRLHGMLPASIGNLSTMLTRLRLDGNYITGNIPPEIGNLVNLDFLSLDSNMLTGSIPDTVGKITRLEGLSVASTLISGQMPLSLGNISLLSQLSLESNRIEGIIPASLSNCSKLETLVLSHNLLTGSIPEKLFGLSSLTEASFNQNYLSGNLPPQMSAMSNLQALDLSGNKFSGEIPRSVGDCTALQSLHMENNLFEGTIPQTLRQLGGLQVLNLSHNNLTGQIPNFLAEHTSLRTLDLSFNMLEGRVPNEGVFKDTSVFKVTGNEDLCGGTRELKLPACREKDLKRNGKRIALMAASIVTGSLLLIALLLACSCTTLYRKQRSRRNSATTSIYKDQHPRISYAEIFEATDGFSEANLIGQGSFGSVYRGTLNLNEQAVAVKVFNGNQQGADHSFMAECEALRSIRHRNLTGIITSCSSIDFNGNAFKALVFKLMSNGSLESWLHPGSTKQQDSKNLSLVQRLSIAIDVASAVDYLHHHCENQVIHCDLKPGNILLDDDFCAHIGDFGLSKSFAASGQGISSSIATASSSAGIRGTIGYVAPEYGMGEMASTEGDMYSYGILLLEMLTAKRPTDTTFSDDLSLRNYVKTALLPDRSIMEIVDSRLTGHGTDKGIISIDEIEECCALMFRVGINCSSELPNERMDVRDVVVELNVIRKKLRSQAADL